MIRIRRIYDDVLPGDKEAILQVQHILRAQLPTLSEKDIRKLPKQLRDPLKYRFRSILFVAEGERRRVKGFALMMHAPDLQFCYLDLIASAPQKTGGGIGGALYEQIRQEARSLKSVGLFFECLPDDPRLCRDPEMLKQNKARLRFYERYGARPIVNTAYETPLTPGEDNPPYLVYDPLGQNIPLPRDTARAIVRAILERKYSDQCPPEYIDMVVESFKDEFVVLREPKYKSKEPRLPKTSLRLVNQHIALAINDQHEIHHVRERGYVESPVRIKTILREIERSGLFEKVKVRHFSEKHIKAVHNSGFVEYLKKVCAHVDPGKSVYPYVFPIRNAARPPKELPIRAGYYCIDTFTPLNENAYNAAKRAVDCALTISKLILEGYRLAYALVRPPGHHAERNAFGGFCYFNSAAIAAEYLSKYGKVAMLDIDYHHGNGAQDIFYERADVLTISIHGHPSFAYPYFSGFEDEKGINAGEGYNLNIPLPEQTDGTRYREALRKALKHIKKFQPQFLVVLLGLDTAKADPTGSWSLRADDFFQNGKMIGALKLPTIVVQEGGYRIRSLGINARHFFLGLWSAARESVANL
jgi:acetoin utilization deacetylase AcuC-like enzyme/GNAT superfamily N-acetyltransferase